jgi:PTH1 family peptidyl-tRNA hydrolase
MNLSGNALRYWMQQEKVSLEHVMVVTDDLALPFGKLRMRGKGSDGGHNGLKHIQQILNTGDYARIRVGVGKEFSKGQQVDYVLGEWTSEEKTGLEEVVQKAAQGCLSFAFIGLALTMNTFNSK